MLEQLPHELMNHVISYIPEEYHFALRETTKGMSEHFRKSRTRRRLYSDNLHRAAYDGNLSLIKYIIKHKFEDTNDSANPARTCGAAAGGGSLNVLKYLVEQGFAITNRALAAAAYGGHVHIFRWIHEHFVDFRPGLLAGLGTGTLHAAARGGHIETMEYLRGRGCRFSKRSSSVAAKAGRLHVLEYLLACGAEFNSETCEAAVLGGGLDTLKWLRNLDPPCPWDTATFATACALGRVDILDYAYAGGCPYEITREFTYKHYATVPGHLDVLRWLNEHECTFSVDDSLTAVRCGHLEIVKWLFELGCPFHPTTCNEAAHRGFTKILKYAHQLGEPWVGMERYYHVHVMMYARELGFV